MNTNMFTGRAEAYAKARPGYPEAVLDYICGMIPAKGVLADIGAGTGKFTMLLAQRGLTVYAVEPNADMRKQLAFTLTSYPNAHIVEGTAEATMLPDQGVDAVTCAQALHWFDPDAFRAECRRILKPQGFIAAVYNITPIGSSANHGKQSAEKFFCHPVLKEFPNPVYYTREKWLTYMTSHSHDPLPSESGYAAHMEEMNALFDQESVEGLLKRDVVTYVYCEKIHG